MTERDQIVKEMKYHCKVYYDGSPEVSDDEFDAMKERLERISIKRRLIIYVQKWKRYLVRLR